MEAKIQTILPKSDLQNWYIVKGMLDSEEIQKLDRDAMALPSKEASTIGIEGGGDYRTSEIRWIPQFDSTNCMFLG